MNWKLGLLGFAIALFACEDFGHDEEEVQRPAEEPVVKDAGVADVRPSDDASNVVLTKPELTCDGVKALVPRATFDGDVGSSSLAPITAVDMYAFEIVGPSSRKLSFVVTEQPDACAIRSSNVRSPHSNEVTFSITRGGLDPDVIGQGTYFTDKPRNPDIDIAFEQTIGSACDDAGEPPVAGAAVIGFIAIESRSGTEIEGVIDLTIGNGGKTRLTFKAPICTGTPTARGVCCGS